MYNKDGLIIPDRQCQSFYDFYAEIIGDCNGCVHKAHAQCEDDWCYMFRVKVEGCKKYTSLPNNRLHRTLEDSRR